MKNHSIITLFLNGLLTRIVSFILFSFFHHRHRHHGRYSSIIDVGVPVIVYVSVVGVCKKEN